MKFPVIDAAVSDRLINALCNTFMHSRRSQSYSARIILDYYSSETTTFGLVLTRLLTPGNNHSANTSRLSDTQNHPDSFIVADNHDQRRFENGAINGNYRHVFDGKGRELTVDLDYQRKHEVNGAESEQNRVRS